MEEPHGNGDSQNIVDESPEEIFFDDTNGIATNAERLDDIRNFRLHENNICRLDSNICPRTNSDTNIGSR